MSEISFATDQTLDKTMINNWRHFGLVRAILATQCCLLALAAQGQDVDDTLTPPTVLGFQAPVVTSREELDNHVNSLVTIRGIAGRAVMNNGIRRVAKNPRILGVAIHASHNQRGLPGMATGILIRHEFPIFKGPPPGQRRNGSGGANNIPPSRLGRSMAPRYTLYEHLVGTVVDTKTVVVESLDEEESIEQATDEDPAVEHVEKAGARPVHEILIGRVKSKIWAHETPKGTQYRITIHGLFKKKGNWKETHTFKRNQLPDVGKAADEAYAWIREERAAKKADGQLPTILKSSGIGAGIPILTSSKDLDAHFGRLIAIRGPVDSTKVSRIIGVEVSGGQNLQDAFAVGVLGKFATTEDAWKEVVKKHRGYRGEDAGSFGSGETYTLFSGIRGHVAPAEEWPSKKTDDPVLKEVEKTQPKPSDDAPSP